MADYSNGCGECGHTTDHTGGGIGVCMTAGCGCDGTRDDAIFFDAPSVVETVDGRKYVITPPRPDYRWKAGKGRVRHEPEHPLLPLPAPPKTAVMVPCDIAQEVRVYAERLEAETALKRGRV